jgi:hypothetical protein
MLFNPVSPATKWNDKPIEFDVARPCPIALLPESRRVWFTNMPGDAVDEGRLCDALARCSGREAIQGISFTWACGLATPAVTAFFPRVWTVTLMNRKLESLSGLEELQGLTDLAINITKSKRRSLHMLPAFRISSLGVRIAKPSDIDYIAGCARVDTLGLTGYSLHDLSNLAHLPLQRLKLVGGTIASAGGLRQEALRSASLVSCGRLSTFGDLRARSVLVDGCQYVDFDSLDAHSELEFLWLLNQAEVRSFRFLRRCPKLAHFEVSWMGRSGTRIIADDWGEIAEHQSLRSVWLADVAEEKIASIAAARPKMAISNSIVYFVGGIRVTREEYFDWRNAQSPSP